MHSGPEEVASQRTLIAVRPLRTWGANGGRGSDLVQIEIAPSKQANDRSEIAREMEAARSLAQQVRVEVRGPAEGCHGPGD